MGSFGTHALRIANMSTPDECKQEGFSQSACGFVIEFVDAITTHAMNDTNTNKGGWPASSMHTYLNNDIYNALPEDLKGVIKDTVTVSGHGKDDTDNLISTDKLYLLSTHEVYENGTSNTISNDTAWNKTRQLDYYKNIGVTSNNSDGAIKSNNGSAPHYWWWLRPASSLDSNGFFGVHNGGAWHYGSANYACGVLPAFRIG